MAGKLSTQIPLPALQQTLTDIYDAGLDAQRWDHTLKSLTQTLGGEQSIMRLIDAEKFQVLQDNNFNKDPYWNQQYREHFIKCDFWLDVFLKVPESFTVLTHEYVPDKEYEKREIHADYLQPQRAYYGMGTIFRVSVDKQAYLTLHRDKKREGFEQDKKDCLNLYLPHIKRALLINEKIEKTNFQNQLLIDALNLINCPLLLVDKDATVILSNSQAEQIFLKLPFLNIKNSKVHTSHPALNNQLQCIIQQATTHSGTLNIPQSNALQYYEPVTQKSIRFVVTPLNRDRVNLTNQKKPLAILMIDCEESSQDLSSRYLRELYGLTQAEALLTTELCRGQSLEEIVNKRSVSRNTLKTQLHTTFHKTGVDRQSALVALIKNGLSGKFRLT